MDEVMPGAAEKALETKLFGDYNRLGSAIYYDDENGRLFGLVDVWRVLRIELDGKFWLLWRTPNFDGPGGARSVHTWRIDDWRVHDGETWLTNADGRHWTVDTIHGAEGQAIWQEFRLVQQHLAGQYAENDQNQIVAALDLCHRR